MKRPDTPRTDAHAELIELLGVYALGIADEPQERAVERHVARCTSCHAELQSLIAAADSLADSVPQHAMPAAVRARIVDEIAEHEQLAATLTPESHSASAGRRRSFRGWFTAGAMRGRGLPIAAALLVALVAVAGVQSLRVADLQDRLDAAPSSGAPGAAATSSSSRASSTDSSTDSMVESSSVFAMDTSGALETATLELVDVHGAGLLVTKDLPDPPAGFEWRVWGVVGDDPMYSFGTLTPMVDDGMGLQPVMGLHEQHLDAVAVTLEPTGAATADRRGPVVGWARMA